MNGSPPLDVRQKTAGHVGLEHALPSLGKWIILAYQDPAPRHLDSWMPVLTSSLTQNVAVDESLALLLTALNTSDGLLQEDIVDGLAAILAPFASRHPNPTFRHIAFRVLARVLARSPPPVHLAHLTSLLSSPYPQMRVAAVGLAKDAFLMSEPLRTPVFLRAVGPAVFRGPDDLSEPCEPARLTACLALYYVLLMRDATNSVRRFPFFFFWLFIHMYVLDGHSRQGHAQDDRGRPAQAHSSRPGARYGERAPSFFLFFALLIGPPNRALAELADVDDAHRRSHRVTLGS